MRSTAASAPPAETAIAYFWVGFNVNQYNQTFQNVVNPAPQLDLVDAAHLLKSIEMGNIVTTDAGIACYDSKFYYQGPGVRSPRSRTPTRTTTPRPPPTPPGSRSYRLPGHPEYPSQHGCFTSAFSDTIAAALHTQRLDVTIPGGGQNGSSNLSTTQHFNTVADVQNQVVDARVWLGFHFRNSVEQGLEGRRQQRRRLGAQAASSSPSIRRRRLTPSSAARLRAALVFEPGRLPPVGPQSPLSPGDHSRLGWFVHDSRRSAMSKKLTAIAALAAAAATLAAVAAAGPVAGKQQLAIQVARCPANAPGCPFTLTPPGRRPRQTRQRHLHRLLLDPALHHARRAGDRDRQPSRDVHREAGHLLRQPANRVGRHTKRLRNLDRHLEGRPRHRRLCRSLRRRTACGHPDARRRCQIPGRRFLRVEIASQFTDGGGHGEPPPPRVKRSCDGRGAAVRSRATPRASGCGARHGRRGPPRRSGRGSR